MNRVLIGIRGGIGDIILFSSLIETFRFNNPQSYIICGTSYGCEKLARSIPFFDEFIIDFRPRYARNHGSGYIYKDRRSGLFIGDIDRYYCLDHPYRDVDVFTKNNVHIIDMAAKIFGIDTYERIGKVFLDATNENNADIVLDGKKNFVLISPLCNQKTKIPDFRLMGMICESFQKNGFDVLCILNGNDIAEISCEKIRVKSILDLAAVIRRSSYYVGLDSGLSHIAAAFGLPMSTIHIAYPPARSGVLNNNAQILYFENRFINEDKWSYIVDKISSHMSSKICLNIP